jgi:hypothetical protein
MQVIIMTGPSGSGKSTWADKTDGTIVSADRYFLDNHKNYRFDPAKLSKAHGYSMREFILNLEARHPLVIVDNTNCSIAEIAPYISVSNAFFYDVRVVTLMPVGGYLDLSVFANRNLHNVPLETVTKQAVNFSKMQLEWPRFWPKIEVVQL